MPDLRRHRFNARLTATHAVLLACALAIGMPSFATEDLLDPGLFPVPSNLEPNVAFWKSVYTEHPSDRALFHDERYLNVVYTVLDFSHLSDLPDSVRKKRRRAFIREVEARYETILRNLAAGREAPEDEADDYARVRNLFKQVPGNASRYVDAIGRFRTQTCLNDRFAEGVVRSGAFLPEIERIFARRGLPKALTRLPFVESLFHTGAHSKASAAGIWQFMPGTAKLYLKMEVEFDERYDPFRATEAAARHLAGNYKALGTWPLALTAYNHGRAGMKRAVKRVGTRDLGRIVDNYRSRTFGFASRNFYSEFIAASQAYQERADHFPQVEPMPELAYDAFTPTAYVSVTALAAATETDVQVLRAMNPAISPSIWRGDLYLPKHYPLRVPTGTRTHFDDAFALLGDDHRSERQRGFYYRVRRGDTVGTIAAKHGTSIRAIQQANKLRSANIIRLGQTLYIPPARGSVPPRVNRATRSEPTRVASAAQAPPSSSPSETTRPANAEPSTYVVRSGDTLAVIAQRHGTRVDVLQTANNLRDANRIVPGQTLRIPNGKRTHHVRRGDTLASIAQRYGTTVDALQSTNRIRSHVIHPAQILIIP